MAGMSCHWLATNELSVHSDRTQVGLVICVHVIHVQWFTSDNMCGAQWLTAPTVGSRCLGHRHVTRHCVIPICSLPMAGRLAVVRLFGFGAWCYTELINFHFKTHTWLVNRKFQTAVPLMHIWMYAHESHLCSMTIHPLPSSQVCPPSWSKQPTIALGLCCTVTDSTAFTSVYRCTSVTQIHRPLPSTMLES